MAKKTTVKPISLGYRPVGSTGAYTPLMGVLKGLAVAQDEADEQTIDAEFFDSPFDVIRTGKPVKFTFELANYELSELPALFGGEIDSNGDYIGAASAFTSEHEWKLDFQRGFPAIVVYKGSTAGTIKKDADGALNYSVTISSLVYHDETKNKDLMYKIAAAATSVTYTEVSSPAADANPKELGYYEKDGSTDAYRLTWDTEVVTGKTYYEATEA